MASAFHQWEADPLFSAAEVVQDSADRMESVFRLLLHERSLVQGDHPDPKVLASIEYHRRDLATTLETAKWQLEDFEREVNLSAAMVDKSQRKQNVISRHMQFIRAIGEQIVHVEKSLKDTSVGDPVRNTEWVNLNEQDRDGLALFLSGGKPVEHAAHQELEERNILRRFLDPTASSSFNDEIDEPHTGETVKLNMNGLVHLDHNSDLEENRIANVSSHFLKQMGYDRPSSIQGTACDRHDQDGSWDLEASEAKGKSLLHKNKLRGYNSKTKVFWSLGNLMSAYGSNANRSFTKRWKDGEEQQHSSSYNDLSHIAQSRFTPLGLGSQYNIFRRLWPELFARRVGRFSSWVGDCWPRYQRYRLSIQLISLMLLSLVLIGLLLSRVA